MTDELRKFYVKAYLGISNEKSAKYWLVFPASVPPLGWNTYYISIESQKGTNKVYSQLTVKLNARFSFLIIIA